MKCTLTRLHGPCAQKIMKQSGQFYQVRNTESEALVLSRANPACSFLLPCVKLVFIDHSSFGIRTFKSSHQSELEFLYNQLGLFILFHPGAMGLTLLLNSTQACRSILSCSTSKDDPFFPQPNEKAKKTH